MHLNPAIPPLSAVWDCDSMQMAVFGGGLETLQYWVWIEKPRTRLISKDQEASAPCSANGLCHLPPLELLDHRCSIAPNVNHDVWIIRRIRRERTVVIVVLRFECCGGRGIIVGQGDQCLLQSG